MVLLELKEFQVAVCILLRSIRPTYSQYNSIRKHSRWSTPLSKVIAFISWSKKIAIDVVGSYCIKKMKKIWIQERETSNVWVSLALTTCVLLVSVTDKNIEWQSFHLFRHRSHP